MIIVKKNKVTMKKIDKKGKRCRPN